MDGETCSRSSGEIFVFANTSRSQSQARPSPCMPGLFTNMPAVEMCWSAPKDCGTRSRTCLTVASSAGTKLSATSKLLGAGGCPRS